MNKNDYTHFPDGATRQFDEPLTGIVAESISKSLAKALALKINGSCGLGDSN